MRNCVFFNDTATTEIYTLSLHDALPIWRASRHRVPQSHEPERSTECMAGVRKCTARTYPSRHQNRAGPCAGDRKSTRLNSSHANISYAVFCLKKKKSKPIVTRLYIRQTC